VPAAGGLPPGVPVGEDNLVRRALQAVGREAHVRLVKRIPAGGGLGGGSADAAAVLRWAGTDDLGLAASLGADVPFCLLGGTVLGEGVGDVLTPLPAPPAHRLVLAGPERGADTGEIYRSYDERPRKSVASVEPVVAALHSGDLSALAGAIGNDLEPITGELVPEVEAYKKELLRVGALGASMSGTGTAVYGIFGGTGEQPRVPFSRVCEPVDVGVEIV